MRQRDHIACKLRAHALLARHADTKLVQKSASPLDQPRGGRLPAADHHTINRVPRRRVKVASRRRFPDPPDKSRSDGARLEQPARATAAASCWATVRIMGGRGEFGVIREWADSGVRFSDPICPGFGPLTGHSCPSFAGDGGQIWPAFTRLRSRRRRSTFISAGEDGGVDVGASSAALPTYGDVAVLTEFPRHAPDRADINIEVCGECRLCRPSSAVLIKIVHEHAAEHLGLRAELRIHQQTSLPCRFAAEEAPNLPSLRVHATLPRPEISAARFAPIGECPTKSEGRRRPGLHEKRAITMRARSLRI